MSKYSLSRTWLVLSLLVGSCVLIAPAQAQLHRAESGGYVLRANIANADNLPPAMLEKYMLRAGGFLLNVVVLKQGEPAPNTGIKAEVVVETRDLIGTRTKIDMRTIEEATGISYLGTFNAPLNDRVLDFDIVVRPSGSNESVKLSFRERLPQTR